MITRILSLAGAAMIAAASQASAQTPAAPAAQPNPILQAAQAAQQNPRGPLINGLCVLNRDIVLANSTVGRYAAQQLQTIQTTTNAELTQATTTAQNDMRTLETQRATLGDQGFATQANALRQRLETLVNTRVQEVQATGQAVERKILEEMTPVVIDSFNARNCSLLVDGSMVILRADAMDITPDVTTRLNAKITQFPIERLTAPPQTAQGAPAPAAPATAAGPRTTGPTR